MIKKKSSVISFGKRFLRIPQIVSFSPTILTNIPSKHRLSHVTPSFKIQMIPVIGRVRLSAGHPGPFRHGSHLPPVLWCHCSRRDVSLRLSSLLLVFPPPPALMAECKCHPPVPTSFHRGHVSLFSMFPDAFYIFSPHSLSSRAPHFLAQSLAQN